MDAVDPGVLTAGKGEQRRDLAGERLPPHVTIPVIAAASLGLWAILIRGVGGLLGLLH
ncbi:MAG: hypothetical protein JO326_00785 [Acetobacteraceae bacterium]|nr:hypothetical protein [Acetobacteraceae bacterium]